MANYAQLNISNYNTITSIPEEHSPNSINTSLAQDWSNAFYRCENITSLPDPFYDTSNASNMYAIFDSCKNLTTIPNFNTSNVTNMSYMFCDCYNLITVPNFNTSKVTNIGLMFFNCTNLISAPNFNTSNVTNMDHTFSQCTNLTTVPNFDTSNVIWGYCIFDGCKNLTTFPIIDYNNMVQVYAIFGGCTNIRGDLYLINAGSYESGFMCGGSGNQYTKNVYMSNRSPSYFTEGQCYGWDNDFDPYEFWMGNGVSCFNKTDNVWLKNIEKQYAEIPWTGNGIYRFPTNKIAIISQYVPGSNNLVKVIEVSPYRDYELLESSGVSVDIIYSNYSEKLWAATSTPQNAVFPNSTVFRFFKDITNMTPDIVDTI